MKQPAPLRLPAGAGCTPITLEAAIAFFGQEAIDAGKRHFATRHRGPWHICDQLRGLAVSAEWKEGPTYPQIDAYTLHGDRSLLNPRQSGYQMEGSVSVDGRRFRAFTTDTLFQLPCGKLVSVACLHVCKNPQPATA
jgi:hypothetical protein